MQFDVGSRIEASKNYQVAGRATVGSESPGAPIWEVVADYLRRSDSARISRLNTPKLKTSPAIPESVNLLHFRRIGAIDLQVIPDRVRPT
jgi:sulfur-oxidizing protein SoxB